MSSRGNSIILHFGGALIVFEDLTRLADSMRVSQRLYRERLASRTMNSKEDASWGC